MTGDTVIFKRIVPYIGTAQEWTELRNRGKGVFVDYLRMEVKTYQGTEVQVVTHEHTKFTAVRVDRELLDGGKEYLFHPFVLCISDEQIIGGTFNG